MIKIILFVTSLWCVSAVAENYPVKPDPDMTSGDYCDKKDSDFSGYRYKEKIPYCIRNVSREMKAEIYRAYGVPEKCWHEYTVDHFIPLFMGGSNQPQNLWPEHKLVKATRQNLEQELYDEMSQDQLKQRKAIEIIVHAKMNPPSVPPSDCH